MSLPAVVRSLVPLLAGLVLGGVGAALFQDSLPGAAGSPEARVAELEAELKKTRNRLAALEAVDADGQPRRAPLEADGRPRTAKSLADQARGIAADVRAGRPVSPDDIFKASKPLIRDLAPLFERLRLKEQQRTIESLSGELTRKYDLTKEQQAALQQWFHGQMNETARQWTELLGRDGTRLEDVVRASRGVRPDRGIEKFMEGILTGDQLSAFRTERMQERTQMMQYEADRKVQQLDQIVGLDETQRDRVFGVMARSSPEYDPAMVLEGAQGAIPTAPVGDRQEALLAVLRPEQRAKYEAERQQRRSAAEKEMAGVGLKLPEGWEIFDESDLR